MSYLTKKYLAELSSEQADGNNGTAVVRKKRIHGNTITDKMIQRALVSTGGVKSAAANYLGISYHSIYKRLKNNPALQEQMEAVIDERIDFTESMLMRLIAQGEIRAITFFLETVGKARGYTKQQLEVAVKHEGSIAIVPGLLNRDEWAAASKQYQEVRESELNRQLKELEQLPNNAIGNNIEDVEYVAVEEQQDKLLGNVVKIRATENI